MWKEIGRPKLTKFQNLAGSMHSLIQTLSRIIVHVKYFDIKLTSLVYYRWKRSPLIGRDWMEILGIRLQNNSINPITSDNKKNI